MKIPRHFGLPIVRVVALFSLISVSSTNAITYDVSRMWTDIFGTGTATLTGTVDVPIGNYTITNGGLTPFTNINLILRAFENANGVAPFENGAPIPLDHVDTSFVKGSGVFSINATSSTLIFGASISDIFSAADINFFNTPENTGYTIGSDFAGEFEAGRGQTFGMIGFLQFPIVFGTAHTTPVPETGSTVALLTPLLLGLALVRQTRRQT